MTAPPSWQLFAACLTADPDLFFGADDEEQRDRMERVDRAQAVCAGCPVQVPCREFAATLGCRWGVWAGEDLEYGRPATPEPAPLCGKGLHLMTPGNSKPIKGTQRTRCRACLRESDRRTRRERHARLRARRREQREEVAA